MFQTIHASSDGELYKVYLSGAADLADLVGDRRLETLTSSDTTIDFWFTPTSSRWNRSAGCPINRQGTELLLAATRFTARTVPLLRGDIVLASHDPTGDPCGLTDAQIQWLMNTFPSRWEERILGRRFARDLRQRRRFRAEANGTAACTALFRPTGDH